MASFQEINGQTQVKSFLQGNLRNGTLSHGYLFCGPSGAGKLAMARALAQAIYCETQVAEACGECASCRKFSHHNIVVYREMTLVDNKKTIHIQQIRDLQRDLNFCAEDQYQKIYVIQDAHLLTTSSANAMLKYLEEPGNNQLAILLTQNEQSIPATVRSRLQIVKFRPPDLQQMLLALTDVEVDLELKQLAVQLASNVDEARHLIESEWFAEYRSLVIELVQVALRNPLRAVITLQQRLQKWKADWKKSLDLLAQMLELLFRDMIYCACQQTNLMIFSEQQGWLTKAALQRDLKYWLGCAERALELRKKRVVHGNWQMILEQFFIQMKER
jgi:DNA polymerase-3 subunit delta'